MTGQHQYEALKLAISDAIFGKSMDTVDELMELVTAYAATVEREAAEKAELYGRLHQVIELFQSGHLSAEAYSKLHSDITARLAALQGPLDDSKGVSA